MARSFSKDFESEFEYDNDAFTYDTDLLGLIEDDERVIDTGLGAFIEGIDDE